MIALNILGCVFAVIGIVYSFSCFARLVYKKNIPSIHIYLMSIGIVGAIACFFIF